MEKTLFVVTVTSDLMLSVILSAKNSASVSVVTTDEAIHNSLVQIGIGNFYLEERPRSIDWSDRDREFKCLYMADGTQFQFNFPDTQLPVWKVLGIDRFSFWYYYQEMDRLYRDCNAMTWEKAYVSADIRHPLGWSIAKYSGREVIGVQSGSLRTREWHDLVSSGVLPWKKLLVREQMDEKILRIFGYKGEISVWKKE